MPPALSLRPCEVGATLVSLGWQIARRRGRHIILVREGHLASLSAPNHKVVAKGTPRSLIRLAGLTVSEFLEAHESL